MQTCSIKDNPSLKEFWNVEDNAEENDGEYIDKNSLGYTDGLGEVAVCVWMADSAISSNIRKFIYLDRSRIHKGSGLLFSDGMRLWVAFAFHSGCLNDLM